MPDINDYLQFAISQGASDFHLSSFARPTYRVHGNMIPIAEAGEPHFTPDRTAALIDEILPALNREQFERSSDTDFAYEVPELGRFRVNVFRDRHGVGAVFRHIPEKILSFEELGLPVLLSEFCKLNKGLVLVTGPTGSGKSTTLAAMIDHVNRNRKEHLITIEDPIEFVHENKKCLVNQREINRHTDSFRAALRAALRQDPDIVLVGEMRDLETTETAIETAETGHLVFGTLHTSTASSSIERMIDQFPPERQAQIRTMLALSLKGVVSQTLLQRKDGNGRVAAMEILVVTHAVSNHIREGKTYQIPSAIQTGRKLGMRMLNDDILGLVQNGLVDPEEAYLKCVDKGDMAMKLQAAGHRLAR